MNRIRTEEIKKTTIFLPLKVNSDLKKWAEKENRSVKNLIEHIVIQAVDRFKSQTEASDLVKP